MVVLSCLSLHLIWLVLADANDPSLLSQEAKDGLKIQDENGHSALITALRGNHTSIALLLLDLGANPNESFLDDDVGWRN